MTCSILIGDVREQLAALDPDSIDCVVTSPPYWGLRDYGVEGQIGMEPTLGEHLAVMVEVFRAVRRVMKPSASLWLNYGDCYAAKPNGRSAAATKAAGNDDRTFRDKPFSTVGPIHGELCRDYAKTVRGQFVAGERMAKTESAQRVMAGALLKPKDLCMVPNRLAIALQDDGWWVRSEIVWGKPNPMPDSSGRYRPSTSHEKIWLLTKSANSFYDSEAVRMPAAEASLDRWAQDVEGQQGSDRANAGGKTNGTMKAVGGRDKQRGHSRRHQGFNDRWDGMTKAEQQENGRLLRNYEPDLSAIVPPEVWRIATAAFSDSHFATFPPALVAPFIMAGCPKDGVVLDPFGGAGTTGLVAEALGRDSVLIELNPEYADMARDRLRADLAAVVSAAPERAYDHGPLFTVAA